MFSLWDGLHRGLLQRRFIVILFFMFQCWAFFNLNFYVSVLSHLQSITRRPRSRQQLSARQQYIQVWRHTLWSWRHTFDKFVIMKSHIWNNCDNDVTNLKILWKWCHYYSPKFFCFLSVEPFYLPPKKCTISSCDEKFCLICNP